MLGHTQQYFEDWATFHSTMYLSDLEHKRHTLPWPIDQPFHLAAYYGLDNYSDPYYKGRHCGIDIQTHAGRPVRCIDSGYIVCCYNDDLRPGLCSVHVQNEGLLCVYAHLEAGLLPESDDLHIPIQQGEIVGKVGTWPLSLRECVTIPPDVEKIFGRTYHHLHLETASINERNWRFSAVHNLVRGHDPLLLLQRLQKAI